VRPAVLFDLDGVLADSRATITRSIVEALADLGYGDRRDDDLRPLIGPPMRLAFGELLGHDPESDEIGAVIEAYRARYGTALLETTGFPGMTEALDEIAAGGMRLGVATSKPLPFALQVLDVLGIRNRFEVIEGPRLDGTEPKTVTLERALRELGPGAIALVGDRRYDVEAAKAHGLLAIGVAWGIGSREELTEAGVDVIVEDPAGIVRWLRDPPRRFSPLPPTGG
jgi:phosphoglycolate phosphatase